MDQTRPIKRRRVDRRSSSESSQTSEPFAQEYASASSSDEGTEPPVTDVKSRVSTSKTYPRKPEPSTLAKDTSNTSDITNTTPTFASLGVDAWLRRALESLAIERPTPIQANCIPQILAGRDCVGGSRTGSGKTIAFAVPILQALAKDPSGIFAVVLTPTRELALQIHQQFSALGSRQSLRALLVTGGADYTRQAIELQARPHVVIATPGRLADLIESSGDDVRRLLRRVRFLVLDEVDRLLAPADHGSMVPDLQVCLGALPPRDARQTCLFTATMTAEVRATTAEPRPKGRPPVFVCEIDVGDVAVPPKLRQTYILVPVTQRESFLHVLLGTPANEHRSTIIFANRRDTATMLEYMLRLLGHRVTALHSGLEQSKRSGNLERFRAGAARILVATDVASRGLDIPEVALVVNYDVPRDPDDYVHRVGRTARAGKGGTSITMIGQRDVDLVLAIEERAGSKMEEYAEENVNVETRVNEATLKLVGENKKEAMLMIEEGREVTGRRKREKLSMKR